MAMGKTSPMAKTKTQRLVRVRPAAHRKIEALTNRFRGIRMIDVIDGLLAGFEKLTPDQQREALTEPDKKGVAA